MARRKKRQTRYRPPGVLAQAAPTDALPGTEAKIEELRRRLERGEELFGAADVLDDPSRRCVYTRRRNGEDVNEGYTEDVRPDPGERTKVVGARNGGRNVDARKTKRYSVLSLVVPTPKELAARLLGFRQRRRMSLRCVELAGHVDHATVVDAEAGRYGRLSFQTLWGLADAYGMSLDELVGREVI